jgi:hypothetical protein
VGNGPTRACTGRPLDTLDLICRVVRLIGGQIGLRYQVCISFCSRGFEASKDTSHRPRTLELVESRCLSISSGVAPGHRIPDSDLTGTPLTRRFSSSLRVPRSIANDQHFREFGFRLCCPSTLNHGLYQFQTRRGGQGSHIAQCSYRPKPQK